MDIKVIEEKLSHLRELWKKTPEKRKIIELRAKALKCALDLYYKDHPQPKLDIPQ